MYISTKKGENFRQITPNGINVTSWSLSKDSKTIILIGQEDKNGDKKFSDDDEMIYQIDLTQGISKMKLTPVSL